MDPVAKYFPTLTRAKEITLLDLGGQLEIQIPVVPTAASDDTEFSTQGRVVHLKRGGDEHQTIVGVEFTGPRFNRMFVSEST